MSSPRYCYNFYIHFTDMAFFLLESNEGGLDEEALINLITDGDIKDCATDHPSHSIYEGIKATIKNGNVVCDLAGIDDMSGLEEVS